MLTKTILVDEEDAPKALELIKSIKSQNLVDDISNDAIDDDVPQIKRKQNIAKIIIIIILSMFAIPFALMLIFYII